MRAERKHILDVLETQQEQGRRDVQQKLRSGSLKFPKPYSVTIGKSKTKETGYVGIYVESLASTR